MTMPHRFYVLDTYRFFGAVAVMMTHFVAHFGTLLGVSVAQTERFYFVDFFFVLSGFVLMHAHGKTTASRADFVQFLQRRFGRLYPLHFVTTLAMAVVAGAVVLFHIKVADPSTLDLNLVVPTLLLIHAWGATSHPGLDFPSWSLSAELFLSLLFPALAALVNRWGWRVTLLACLVFALAMQSGRSYFDLRSWYLATHDGGALRAVPLFVSGMAVQALVEHLPPLRLPRLVPHAFALILTGLMVTDVPVPAVLALFPVLVGMIALDERDHPASLTASRTFVTLGNTAFGIFLLHSFIGIGALHLARGLHITALPSLVVVMLAASLATIAAAYCSHEFFEKPMMRRIQGFFARRAAVAPLPMPQQRMV